jgi:twitching motility protein PilT
VFRRIPALIPTLTELNLPKELETFAHMRSGLVLVTGCTGSGKTSTLAAIINLINYTYRKHIITLEDPIEYVYTSKKSVIHQRGLYDDIVDFQSGVVAALREDPDVVLVGEMRDLDTIRLALTAAEVGTLVFATLHTNSAVSSINRIIDVFPSNQQSQIRAQLSFVLQGVMTQLLLPRADGPGRVMASEVMIPNPAIRNLIREDKVHQIYSQIQIGQGKSGMQTMNQSLYALYQRRLISLEDAMGYAGDPNELHAMIEGRAPMVAAGPVRGR